MINILFAGRQQTWDEYQGPLAEALTDRGLEFSLLASCPPEEVDDIV